MPPVLPIFLLTWDIIDEANVIRCIDCHARLLKDVNIIDSYLKITILTSNNEQYNLRIEKSLLMVILAEISSDSIENNDCSNSSYNLNSIISLNTKFTYSEITGIISDIATLKDIESTHRSNVAVTCTRTF
ncbi:unnamed protein product [Rotaria socialis]|uniref:Uncharacterized protein n=1 Tax=Rotaria socialis TaxID=392032 RepID=A0A818XT84_9BILA|nr:unnamed protein product [Rotaria socialis]